MKFILIARFAVLFFIAGQSRANLVTQGYAWRSSNPALTSIQQGTASSFAVAPLDSRAQQSAGVYKIYYSADQTSKDTRNQGNDFYQYYGMPVQGSGATVHQNMDSSNQNSNLGQLSVKASHELLSPEQADAGLPKQEIYVIGQQNKGLSKQVAVSGQVTAVSDQPAVGIPNSDSTIDQKDAPQPVPCITNPTSDARYQNLLITLLNKILSILGSPEVIPSQPLKGSSNEVPPTSNQAPNWVNLPRQDNVANEPQHNLANPAPGGSGRFGYFSVQIPSSGPHRSPSQPAPDSETPTGTSQTNPLLVEVSRHPEYASVNPASADDQSAINLPYQDKVAVQPEHDLSNQAVGSSRPAAAFPIPISDDVPQDHDPNQLPDSTNTIRNTGGNAADPVQQLPAVGRLEYSAPDLVPVTELPPQDNIVNEPKYNSPIQAVDGSRPTGYLTFQVTPSDQPRVRTPIAPANDNYASNTPTFGLPQQIQTGAPQTYPNFSGEDAYPGFDSVNPVSSDDQPKPNSPYLDNIAGQPGHDLSNKAVDFPIPVNADAPLAHDSSQLPNSVNKNRDTEENVVDPVPQLPAVGQQAHVLPDVEPATDLPPQDIVANEPPQPVDGGRPVDYSPIQFEFSGQPGLRYEIAPANDDHASNTPTFGLPQPIQTDTYPELNSVNPVSSDGQPTPNSPYSANVAGQPGYDLPNQAMVSNRPAVDFPKPVNVDAPPAHDPSQLVDLANTGATVIDPVEQLPTFGQQVHVTPDLVPDPELSADGNVANQLMYNSPDTAPVRNRPDGYLNIQIIGPGQSSSTNQISPTMRLPYRYTSTIYPHIVAGAGHPMYDSSKQIFPSALEFSDLSGQLWALDQQGGLHPSTCFTSPKNQPTFTSTVTSPGELAQSHTPATTVQKTPVLFSSQSFEASKPAFNVGYRTWSSDQNGWLTSQPDGPSSQVPSVNIVSSPHEETFASPYQATTAQKIPVLFSSQFYGTSKPAFNVGYRTLSSDQNGMLTSQSAGSVSQVSSANIVSTPDEKAFASPYGATTAQKNPLMFSSQSFRTYKPSADLAYQTSSSDQNGSSSQFFSSFRPEAAHW